MKTNKQKVKKIQCSFRKFYARTLFALSRSFLPPYPSSFLFVFHPSFTGTTGKDQGRGLKGQEVTRVETKVVRGKEGVKGQRVPGLWSAVPKRKTFWNAPTAATRTSLRVLTEKSR